MYLMYAYMVMGISAESWVFAFDRFSVIERSAGVLMDGPATTIGFVRD